MRHYLLAVAALWVMVGAAGRAEAQVITNHASTVASVYAAPNPGLQDPKQGPLSSASSESDSASNRRGSVTVKSNASSIAIGGSYASWSETSHAEMSVTHGTPDIASATGGATWTDILYLGTTAPSVVGGMLRFNFVASGTLAFSGGFDVVSAGSEVGLSASAKNGLGAAYESAAGANLQTDGTNLLFSASGNWDSAPTAGGSFTGTFHLDVPIVQGVGYDQARPGSILFTVQDGSSAGGQFNPTNSTSFLSASDPFQIQSITLPDVGNVTPESLGVSLTFDSGLLSPNVASVPEPSSLTLALFAIVGSLAYGWRRRNLSPARC